MHRHPILIEADEDGKSLEGSITLTLEVRKTSANLADVEATMWVSNQILPQQSGFDSQVLVNCDLAIMYLWNDALKWHAHLPT